VRVCDNSAGGGGEEGGPEREGRRGRAAGERAGVEALNERCRRRS